MLSGKKLFEKEVDDINLEDIQEFVYNIVIEDEYLEYKTLNGSEKKFKNSENRKTLFKEICAFLNTDGGLLIYGIDDLKEGQDKFVGVELDPDRDLLSIKDMIKTDLKPGVSNLFYIRAIKIKDKQEYILIIKINKGDNGPYESLSNSKFYKREGSSSVPMSQHDILAYERNKNYYSDVKVTFEGDLEEANCSPIFEREITIYKQKIENPFMGSYDLLGQLNKSIYSPSFNQPKTNHSFSSFRLKIKNIGKQPIEDYVLKLKFEGDLFEIDDTNETGGLSITPNYNNNPYQMFFNNEKFTIEICPNRYRKVLVSKNSFILPRIYFISRCDENHTVFLKWDLLSRDFNESGKLKINVCPTFKTIIKEKYVEDPSEVREEKLKYHKTSN